MINKHTLCELRQRQALPLKAKVLLAKKRIDEWYNHWNGNVYISFSGGKDSTVLLHIARQIHSDIKAVYCDTGLEYPEIKSFVKSFDNVEIIRPDLNFKKIIQNYGWVFPNKEVATIIRYAKQSKVWALNRLDGKETSGQVSRFKERYKKWKNLINAPFLISEQCCKYNKKRPFKKYEKLNNIKPIIGLLAEESALRTTSWIKSGCNVYSKERATSRPLSIWTEQDILAYIKLNNLSIPSVYGEIITKDGKLCTSKAQRTGCIFCLSGCHLEHGKNRRFLQLKDTHPKIYDYCMNELKMRELLDYIARYCNCKESLY